MADRSAGVYFDITMEDTTSLLLALYNAPEPEISTSANASSEVPTSLSSAGYRHFHFYPISSNEKRKKVLEVITDSPGSFSGKRRGRRAGGADGLFAGVMAWDYLLGEMFGADHVSIVVEGICLTPDCKGGTGEPVGMGDVFFRL